MPFHLEPLASLVIDDNTKAIPAGVRLPLAQIGRQGWNLLAGDVPLPAAILRSTALQHNSRWMQRFVAQRGALIAPHVKTTMCPQIMALQLADGAWALTVATVQQMQVCLKFGASRLLLANQVVGRAELDAVARALKSGLVDLMMIADSREGVEAAAAAMRRGGVERPLPLLVERGFAGGRSGCRTNQSALELARYIHAQPELCLIGVEVFEGLIKAPGGGEAQTQAVAAFIDEVAALFQACAQEKLFSLEAPIVTAGGSAYYDIVMERLAGCGARVVTRSGCYVTHDSGMYHDHHQRLCAATDETGGLRRALELWSHVQSLPEPGLALLTAGRRDCGTDSGFPVPLLLARANAKNPAPEARPKNYPAPEALPEGCKVINLNDQHCYLHFPPGLDLAIGDRIGLGVSHPCTTFDKWDLLYLVDDDYTIIDAFKTYF